MDYKKLSRIYHGKIMLFGEYAVMEGSWAALIPYRKIKASLVISNLEDANNLTIKSNESLKRFAAYLEKCQKQGKLTDIINLQQLNKDIERGLWFVSGIPENYGLGSSGAVCASVFETYRRHADFHPLSFLRTIFSQMESFFHGSSSGMDPLCIYLDEPLVIRNNECYLPAIKPEFAGNFLKPFLIDTGKKSLTAPLVKHFRERMKDSAFKTAFNENYIPLVNRATEQWLSGGLQSTAMKELSLAQYQYLKDMIPVAMLETWEHGIESELYTLKLCGSGGGGMLLGFTGNISETRNYLLSNFKIKIEVP
jgi:mevalonate kinase